MKPRRIALGTFLIAALGLLAACGGNRAGDPATALGRLQVTRGTALLEGTSLRKQVATNGEELLFVGQMITSGPASEVLVLSGPQVHVLGPDTQLKFESVSADRPAPDVIHVLGGMVTFFLPPDAARKSRFEVRVGRIVAAVKGTLFRVETEGDGVVVTVVKGEVEVLTEGAGGARATLKLLSPGQSGRINSEGKYQENPVTPDAIGTIEKDLLLRRSRLGTAVGTF